MFCYKCGKQLDDEAVICPGCGCATKNYGAKAKTSSAVNSNASDKSRLIALILCVFVGFLGVHRFYIGKIGTGILWLLTAGCFGIGALIDLIMIACGKMEDADGRLIEVWE